MDRQRIRYVLALALIVCCTLTSGTALAAARIASWNVRHLGWANDKDLGAVAAVVSRFDLVALQEVMEVDAAQQLARDVSRRTGEPWGVLASAPVGNGGYKESYAFLWRKSQVTQDGGAVLYLDPGNHFAREPLSARFIIEKDGERVPIVVATVHIVYGDSTVQRRAEIRALDEYWRWLGATFDGHRLLMGDFNRPPDDPAWRVFDRLARPMITHGASTLSTHDGRYAHLYDNIWSDGAFGVTQRGIARFPRWLGLTHREARRRVSDHAPVYIVIGAATVDAAPLTGVSARAAAKRACIDLNTAAASELDRLDHIGPSRARSIVAGRPWATVDELVRVRGLSSRRVADIRANARACVANPE